MELPSLFASQSVAMPDWLISCWHFCLGFISWCFSAADDDRTALGAIFALNASFASIDSFTKSFMESMRRVFRRKIAKYKDPRWLKSVGKDDSAVSLNKREQLADVANEVLVIENEIPMLFTAKARFWKFVMGACATVALWCMVVPYTGRVLVLLALPLPLFYWRCLKEKAMFEMKTEKACAEIDKNYDRIKGHADDPAAAGSKDILVRLDSMEKALASLTVPESAKPKTRRKSTKK